MFNSINEYEPQLFGRITDKGLWGEGETLDFNDLDNAPSLAKFTLGDLYANAREAFAMGSLNMRFFDLQTIATDSYTAKHGMNALLDGEFDEKNTGWVYMYTYVPELVLGLSLTSFGDEELASVRCRIKIGMSGVSPFDRVDDQIATSSAHTAILLGLFYTPDVKRADKGMKLMLEGYRPVETGGEEWYFGSPEEFLVKILQALEPSRTPKKVIPNPTKQ